MSRAMSKLVHLQGNSKPYFSCTGEQGWRDEVRLGQRRAKRVQRMLGVALQASGWLWLVWFMYPFYDSAAAFAKGLGIAGLVLVFVAVVMAYAWDKLEESQEV